jgi:hypothetical protein
VPWSGESKQMYDKNGYVNILKLGTKYKIYKNIKKRCLIYDDRA